jgi:hypothetical protein
VPTEAVPTEAVPTEAVPTEAVPTEAVPTEAVPTEAVPTTPFLVGSRPTSFAPTSTSNSCQSRIFAQLLVMEPKKSRIPR